MARKPITPSRQATDALHVLGTQIRLGRHQRNWSVAELATRAGVGPRTIRAIEQGAAGTAIGTAFTAASLVGVELFGATGDELTALRRRGEERIALIPSREYRPRRPMEDADDDALDF